MSDKAERQAYAVVPTGQKPDHGRLVPLNGSNRTSTPSGGSTVKTAQPGRN